MTYKRGYARVYASADQHTNERFREEKKENETKMMMMNINTRRRRAIFALKVLLLRILLSLRHEFHRLADGGVRRIQLKRQFASFDAILRQNRVPPFVFSQIFEI